MVLWGYFLAALPHNACCRPFGYFAAAMDRDEIILQAIGGQAQESLFQSIIHVSKKSKTTKAQGASSRGAASEQSHGLPLEKALQLQPTN